MNLDDPIIRVPRRYKSMPVPFVAFGNERILTQKQLVDSPELEKFVQRFRHCFDYDVVREIYIYRPEND